VPREGILYRGLAIRSLRCEARPTPSPDLPTPSPTAPPGALAKEDTYVQLQEATDRSLGLRALVVSIVAMVPRVDDSHLLQEMPS